MKVTVEIDDGIAKRIRELDHDPRMVVQGFMDEEGKEYLEEFIEDKEEGGN